MLRRPAARTVSASVSTEVGRPPSDDGVTYAAVTDDDVVKDAYAPTSITGGIVRALTAAHAAATVQKLGYVGSKRYVKLLADFSGTHGTGTPIAAIVNRTRAALRGAA